MIGGVPDRRRVVLDTLYQQDLPTSLLTLQLMMDMCKERSACTGDCQIRYHTLKRLRMAAALPSIWPSPGTYTSIAGGCDHDGTFPIRMLEVGDFPRSTNHDRSDGTWICHNRGFGDIYE